MCWHVLACSTCRCLPVSLPWPTRVLLGAQVGQLKKQLASQSLDLQAERSSAASTRQQLEQLKQEFKSAGGGLGPAM
jgi:hypothetical protein